MGPKTSSISTSSYGSSALRPCCLHRHLSLGGCDELQVEKADLLAILGQRKCPIVIAPDEQNTGKTIRLRLRSKTTSDIAVPHVCLGRWIGQPRQKETAIWRGQILPK